MAATSTTLLTLAMVPLRDASAMAAAACLSAWSTSPWRAENSAQAICTEAWWVAPGAAASPRESSCSASAKWP